VIPWEWITPVVIMSVFGFFIGKAALADRRQQKPELEVLAGRWRPAQVWWARKRTGSEHRRHHQLLPKVGARRR